MKMHLDTNNEVKAKAMPIAKPSMVMVMGN